MERPDHSHPLPEPLGSWIEQILGAPLTGEPPSTCERCAMTAVDGIPPTTAYAFDPRVRCCTYLPALPNFLVGGALLAGGEAADSVRQRMAAGVGVDPLGLSRPPGYDLVFDNAINAQGRALSLRCPHFLEGREHTCAIHGHRNHLCWTWFCKYERGERGFHLWRAVEQLAHEVELHLARHCALEEGVPAVHLVRSLGQPGQLPKPLLNASAVDGVQTPAHHAQLWGPWVGREEELYMATARRAEAMSWEEVLGACGPEVRIRALALRQAWEDYQQRALPERLQVGLHNLMAVGPSASLAITYSSLDPVEVPVLLASVLHYFDGRPTAEALEAIEEERGLRFEEELLLRIVDWGVLRSV